MKDFAGPPYDCTDQLSWLAYADWLQEQGRDTWEWRKALRFAEGCRRTNAMERLILVCEFISRFDIRITMPIQPTPIASPERVMKETDAVRNGTCFSLHWHPARINLHWLTHRGCAMKTSIHGPYSSPGQFPQLIEKHPDVADAFFMKISAGLSITMRNGIPWLREKPPGKRNRPLWRPYFNFDAKPLPALNVHVEATGTAHLGFLISDMPESDA